MSKFSTPYSRAWEAFAVTAEFKDILATIIKEGCPEPYATNRLRTVFDGGWNSKTSYILDALNQMADKKETPNDPKA